MEKRRVEATEQANKTSRIKLYLTIVLLVLILVVGIFISDQSEGYPMNINTKAGTTWSYEIADTSVIQVSSEPVLENGKFKLRLEGISEGETYIYMTNVLEDGDKVLEKRSYHMYVNDKLDIVQKSVDREAF